ncbi:Putative flippase GtrA (transmembrane translocase of bactoprenol-linked glucose) [Segatella baroniae B14]|nr:Putative flippase GtrA (transmembrane translocase of bactoprenol-linked glucose) [Segatella baroniae B14]
MIMGKIKHEIWLLSKAEISASIASIVDFGLAIFLTYCNILEYTYANIIGIICGGITNCCINSKYVFDIAERKKKDILFRYFTVWTASLILNGFGTNMLTGLLGNALFIPIKSCIAFLVAIFFNYPLQRNFVFTNKNKYKS